MTDGPVPPPGRNLAGRLPRRPPRPALIVSPDARNQYATSVLAVPVTTNLRPTPTHVPLPAGQGGLAHDSMARCENVSYLHKSRLARGPLAGPMASAQMADVERCLLRSLGLTT